MGAMPDELPPSDMTSSHPTARHLRCRRRPRRARAPTRGPSRPPSRPRPALPHDVVSYGPDIADERTFKLLGNVEGKRVLELGCGGGQNAVALAKQGARVITVDPVARAPRAGPHRLRSRGGQGRAARGRPGRSRLRPGRHHRRSCSASTRWPPSTTSTACSARSTACCAPSAHSCSRSPTPRSACSTRPRPTRSSSPAPTGTPPPARGRPARPRATTTRARSATCSPRSPGPASASTPCSSPSRRADAVHSPYWSTTMAWVPATLVVRARKEGL